MLVPAAAFAFEQVALDVIGSLEHEFCIGIQVLDRRDLHKSKLDGTRLNLDALEMVGCAVSILVFTTLCMALSFFLMGFILSLLMVMDIPFRMVMVFVFMLFA